MLSSHPAASLLTPAPSIFAPNSQESPVSERRIPDSPDEESLVASGGLLATILSSIVDGLTVQDLSGRLVYANEAAARAIGYASPQELLHVPQADMLAQFTLVDEHG